MLLIGRHAFQSADGASTLGGDACFLAAAASWGLYGQLVRRWQVDPRTAAASITVCSALLYLPIYLLCLPKGYALATTGQIALQAGYQGVIAGVVASLCYMFATLRIGPTRASLMLALVPPISACLAVPLLGEPLTLETGLGALLVTCAAIFGASGGSGVRR
jgi:drug/metabolite transporter (DMT)-like permease